MCWTYFDLGETQINTNGIILPTYVLRSPKTVVSYIWSLSGSYIACKYNHIFRAPRKCVCQDQSNHKAHPVWILASWFHQTHLRARSHCLWAVRFSYPPPTCRPSYFGGPTWQEACFRDGRTRRWESGSARWSPESSRHFAFLMGSASAG